MTDRPDIIGEAGLQFFGRMSASISHELKNALAIIRENAGLLDDYVQMMAKGSPVDPDRFRTVARRIDGQTRRADAIIKDLNQFAHTVDSTSMPEDLNRMLDLLAALHRRTAAMREVSLEVRHAEPTAVITTAPFLLLNALGLLLGLAISQSLPDGQVVLEATKTPSGAEICITIAGPSQERPVAGSAQVHENALLTALGAKAIIESGPNRIIVQLPLQP